MDLKTNYMGLTLNNPIVVSSSGFTNNIDSIKKIAGYGAGAVVLKSLFEEQIVHEIDVKLKDNEMYFWYPEAKDYVQHISKNHGIEQYLDLIKEAKKAVDIPVIASINCMTPAEWPAFSKRVQDAGADGLELNISILPTNDEISSCDIEMLYIEIVEAVKKHTTLPIAVKISPYFTNLSLLCSGLAKAGADAIVLFNRYYKPDIDINKMAVIPNKYYSNSDELSESIRWIGLLSQKNMCHFAASTGIHKGDDVIKALLVGAEAAEIATVLYKNGLEYIPVMLTHMKKWMENKGFTSLSEFRGKLAKGKEANFAFERVQFMKKTTNV